MKGVFLSALLALSVPVASAQGLSSARQYPVQAAQIVVQDRSFSLSPEQVDALQQRLERKQGRPGVHEDDDPVLFLIVDAYALKQGWHHVTLSAELTEVVERIVAPSRPTHAVTWGTNSGHIYNAAFYTPVEGITAALEKVTDELIAGSSQIVEGK